MALINCPECGTEVSDKAEKCPKCAYPLNLIVNTPVSEKKSEVIINHKGSKKWPSYYKWLVVIVPIIAIGATLPFHYVPNAFKVFPKGRLTFSHTIITQKDIDDMLNRYDACGNIFEQKSISKEPLFSKLVEYGIIKPVEKIKNRTWEGQIYRIGDNKQLSDVKMKLTDDTIYVFANAIFGAGNDTLILKKYDEKDSTFTYKNSQGETILLKSSYKHQEGKAENLYFFGIDFYLTLGVSNTDIFSPGALDFYQHISVPRQAYMYLDGAYEGSLEFENAAENYLFQAGYGMKFKFIFEDGFRVKILTNGSGVFTMLMGSEVKTKKYTIKGDKIYIEGGGNPIKIADGGYKLVMQSDKSNIILRKVY